MPQASSPNLHPPAFQPNTQVASSQAGPPPTATQFLQFPNFLQGTQAQAQPMVTQIQPTPSQFASSGPTATQPFLLRQTQVQGLQAQSSIQPPPVSQLYQHIQPLQPATSTTVTSRPGTTQAVTSRPGTSTVTSRPGMSFNPFLGGAALGLPTTHANQARLASALSSIPRNPTLPRRGRRGPAQHPPALPSSRKVSINNCLSQDASGSHSLRIIVKVMPPPVSSSSHIIGFSDLLHSYFLSMKIVSSTSSIPN